MQKLVNSWKLDEIKQPEEVVNQFKQMNSRTPDFFNLKAIGDDLFLIFVYDDLMLNKLRSGAIHGAIYYGKGLTISAYYKLKKTDDSKAVAFYYDKGQDDQGRNIYSELMTKIKGEIYAVPLRALTRLDHIYANGDIFHRHKSHVVMVEQNYNPTHACFMYLGDKEYWDRHTGSINMMRDHAKINVGRDTYAFFS